MEFSEYLQSDRMAGGPIFIAPPCICPHDKTKTAETKTAKLGTGIVNRQFWPIINIRSKVKVIGSQSAKRRSIVAGVSYALYQLSLVIVLF